MYLAEVFFPFGKARKKSAVADAAGDLIGCWYKNGQIWNRDWSLIADKTGIRAFLVLPERTALSGKHARKYVTDRLEKLAGLGVEPFRVTILGRELETMASCRCRKPDAYYLFASHASPLWCGQCHQPVPLYRIPPTYDDSEYHDLLGWRKDYLACDGLWFSGLAERHQKRQLASPDSELSKTGRMLAAKVETLTGVPTYYYLFRYNGRSLAAEKATKCIVCAGDWLLEKRWDDFDFRCDRCRLISNIAFDVR